MLVASNSRRNALVVRSLPVTGRAQVARVDDVSWTFNGVTRHVDDVGWAVIAHATDLVGVPARELAILLRRNVTYGYPTVLDVVADGDPGADFEYLQPGPVAFTLGADQKLLMTVEHFEDADDETGILAHATRLLKPLLERHRMWISDASEIDYGKSGPFWSLSLHVAFHLRGQTLDALHDVGMQIAALLDASAGGELTVETCIELLRAGHAEALIGIAEADWLEAKRQHFPLKHLTGKVRLAETVAQFANASDGGLIVFGLETKTVQGVDVIQAVTPEPHDPRTRRRIVQALQERLFPPPNRLTVEVIKHHGAELALIVVPAQPEELKPFLVHGAVIDGQARGTHISIVNRYGDEALATSPAALHATLAAGRALLRRGELPEGS